MGIVDVASRKPLITLHETHQIHLEVPESLRENQIPVLHLGDCHHVAAAIKIAEIVIRESVRLQNPADITVCIENHIDRHAVILRGAASGPDDFVRVRHLSQRVDEVEAPIHLASIHDHLCLRMGTDAHISDRKINTACLDPVVFGNRLAIELIAHGHLIQGVRVKTEHRNAVMIHNGLV